MTEESLEGTAQALGRALRNTITSAVKDALRQGSTQEVNLEDLLAGRPLAEIERAAVLGTLRMCGDNRKAAAEKLGIGERTLYRFLATVAEGKPGQIHLRRS